MLQFNNMKRLSFKRRNFIKEYVKNGGNGTQAALKTYNTDDYNTAHVIASEILQNPTIQKTIDETARDVGVTTDTILGNFNHFAVQKPDKVTADAVIKANIELAKILRMYPDKKSYQFSMSVKGKVKDLGYSEAKKQLDELNKVRIVVSLM